MVKHTQTNLRPFADEFFECVRPFCGVGTERVKVMNHIWITITTITHVHQVWNNVFVWYDGCIQKFLCFNFRFGFNIMVWISVTAVCVYTPFSLTMGVSFNRFSSPRAFITCFIIFHASSVPDFGPFINIKSNVSRAWFFKVPRLLVLIF